MSKIDPKKTRVSDLTDEQIRPILERLFEDPKELAVETEHSEEAHAALLRVEVKRQIANHRRDMRIAGFAPVCPDNGENPLHSCVLRKTPTKKVTVYLRLNDSEIVQLPATIGFTRKAYDDLSEFTDNSLDTSQPNSTLQSEPDVKKTESEIIIGAGTFFETAAPSSDEETNYHWFTLEAELPKNVSIVAAELFPNPKKVSTEELASPTSLPKELADNRLALFTCRRIHGSTNRFELFTRAPKSRLIDLKSVFVLRVKEAAQ